MYKKLCVLCPGVIVQWHHFSASSLDKTERRYAVLVK